MTNLIISEDPEDLIVLLTDHGGFVGFDTTEESRTKQKDSALVNSIFSSLLVIKWPENNVPSYDDKLKTNENLFRVISTYLSNKIAVLNHLEKDSSYNIIDSESDYGVYELIEEEGNSAFNKEEK